MELKKGVNIRVINTDKFATSMICVLFRRELCKNESTLNAMLASVLSVGCRKYSSVCAFNSFLEKNGDMLYKADIVKKGEEQIIELLVQCGRGYEETGVRLIADILKYPMITDFETERKKLELERTIKAEFNDKDLYAKERCIELMCEGEKIAISGDGYIEDLKHISRLTLERHFEKVVNESAVSIMAVGDIDEVGFVNMCDKYFDFKDRPGDIPSCDWQAERRSERVNKDRCAVAQSKLYIGIRTNINPVGDEWYKALVANELFANGGNSALFKNVREKKGLCYYINCLLYRSKALMLVRAGIDSAVFNDVVSAVKQIVEDIKTNGFDADDVKSAAEIVARSFEIMTDSQGAILDFYLGQAVVGDDCDISQTVKNIMSVKSIDSFFDNAFIDMIYLLEGE